MAKVQVLGDAAVVVSGIQHDVLAALTKYAPKSLKLTDKETKDELFAVGLGSTPHIGKYGITFSGKNEAGFATATFQIPTGLTAEKKNEFVRDSFGFSLLSLNKLEAAINGAAEALAGDINAINEAVEILG